MNYQTLGASVPVSAAQLPGFIESELPKYEGSYRRLGAGIVEYRIFAERTLGEIKSLIGRISEPAILQVVAGKLMQMQGFGLYIQHDFVEKGISAEQQKMVDEAVEFSNKAVELAKSKQVMEKASALPIFTLPDSQKAAYIESQDAGVKNLSVPAGPGSGTSKLALAAVAAVGAYFALKS